MSEVKLPEGYKQTEVGVIPEDWEVKDIGEALTIKHGKDQKQVESSSGQYPIFGTGGQMGWANNFLYNKPSVLIGRKGSINKPRYIDVPFWTVDTLFYSQVHNGYDEKFMFYKFCLIDWMNYNEASGVPSLNASTISNVKISVPKKLEQTAIATALSDVDNLIQSLEKLIAKKEAIKTGTMQHLLTGKTRLPEFATHENGSAKGFKQTELGRIPEDWEVSTLGAISNFINGRAYSLHEWKTAGTPVIRLQNLTGRGENYYYSDLRLPEKQYCVNGDLLFMWSATFGPVIWRGPRAIFHYHIWKVICESGYSQSYLFYLLSDMTEKLKQGSSSGGTMLHITKQKMESINAAFPNEQEQTAIATILSDIDTEIQALQQRLEKTKDIKQGMMQQLLTGKVRLAH